MSAPPNLTQRLRRVGGEDHPEDGQDDVGGAVRHGQVEQVPLAKVDFHALRPRALTREFEQRGEASIPTTLAPRLAASSAALPVPQATSMTSTAGDSAAISTTACDTGSSSAAVRS